MHPQTNDVGVYVLGREDMDVPLTLKGRWNACVKIAHDEIDGRYRIGIEANAPTCGFSYAPSVDSGEAFNGRLEALVIGLDRIAEKFRGMGVPGCERAAAEVAEFRSFTFYAVQCTLPGLDA